jgi:hypothetical protein
MNRPRSVWPGGACQSRSTDERKARYRHHPPDVESRLSPYHGMRLRCGFGSVRYQWSRTTRLAKRCLRGLRLPKVLDDGLEDFRQVVSQRCRVQMPRCRQQGAAELLRRGDDRLGVRFDEGSQTHGWTSDLAHGTPRAQPCTRGAQALARRPPAGRFPCRDAKTAEARPGSMRP